MLWYFALTLFFHLFSLSLKPKKIEMSRILLSSLHVIEKLPGNCYQCRKFFVSGRAHIQQLARSNKIKSQKC